MTPSILREILETRRLRVAEAEARVSLTMLRAMSAGLPPPCDFGAALRGHPYGIIAEVKKASPSRGVLRADFDPVALARAYAQGGAAAISAVTEPDYFAGSLTWLAAIRESVPLPLLRKDFVFCDYQIWESRAAGADAVLLILAMLTDDQARQLMTTATLAGLQTLIEVHDTLEAQRAAHLGASLVGVNNRDLSTFEVSLATSRELAPSLPADAVRVSESGIFTHEQCCDLAAHGFHAFLVGEALVTSEDPSAAVASLVENHGTS
jgi:indole-3-glycerol phosphate synthase